MKKIHFGKILTMILQKKSAFELSVGIPTESSKADFSVIFKRNCFLIKFKNFILVL